ncbi:flagellar biosynthetic protein FliR [Mesorhizobium sp. Z1-4]|uniref:flagellar biosynthetic protein FliR n=1 Tax=Mesorhizobium sp. Z1-4 TaxID=2448478 RepID=UPI000FDB3C27|nr:flagellar biosynthetic protein FliR [Mesorhizobium sp. Z1-4]
MPIVQGVVIAAFLAFCRIGGCFMLMPGLSSIRVPTNVRLFVAVAVSFALLAHMWESFAAVVTSAPTILAPLIVAELLVGALIGLMARFYLLALQFMASAISLLSGLGGMPGQGIEELDAQTPLAGIISLSALVVLFALDFHHLIIEALVASYRLVPLGTPFDAQGALTDLTDVISEAFLVVLRLGSPFIAYAILVNLAAGLINKLSPQVPVYFVSLPFVITGALILAYLAFGPMISLFADGFATVVIDR